MKVNQVEREMQSMKQVGTDPPEARVFRSSAISESVCAFLAAGVHVASLMAMAIMVWES